MLCNERFFPKFFLLNERLNITMNYFNAFKYPMVVFNKDMQGEGKTATISRRTT